jgi:hypothetical protein
MHAAWRLILMVGCACLAGRAAAQADAPPETDDPFGLAPLLDAKAPRVALWFVSEPDIRPEDAAAIEGQVFKDFSQRSDIRLMAQARVQRELARSGRQELGGCRGEDACLAEIGKLLQTDRMIGAHLTRLGSGYRLLLKAIDLTRAPPVKLNSVVEGSLSELVMGGLASGVQATFDLDVEPAPIDGAEPAPPARKEPPPEALAERPPPYAGAEIELGPVDPPRARPVEERPRDELGVQADPPEGPGFFRRHLGSLICLGVGLAAGGAGVGLGVASRDAASQVERQWDPGLDSTGRDQALAANVLFGLAGAAALTAIILFILEPGADEAAPAVQPAVGGAAIRF